MNAAERMEAKVQIRKLEKEGKFTEALGLAMDSAAKCWDVSDIFNHDIFEKLAERMKSKGEVQE